MMQFLPRMPDRRIKTWNLGAENLYGFTKQDALDHDSHTLLRTALKPEEIDDLLKKVETTDYWKGELRRKTKSGGDIYVFSSITTLRDDKNTITGYVAVSFDITEQKKLREQINHLASIVEQSSEGIISRDVNQRMVSWNPGAELLFGYSKQEAIGKSVSELGFTMMTEQEIATVSQQIIASGSWKSERDLYHKNGSSFFASVTANAVRNEHGEISAIVFIIKDISLRKQLENQLIKYNEELENEVKVRTNEILKSEKRFQALIENSNDVVTFLDKSFKIYYRSPSAYRVTGWTDKEMINADGAKNIHPDDLTKAKEILKELEGKPGIPINCLLRNQHKSGHYLWMEGVVINLLEQEHVNAIVFNFRDVTDRVNAGEKLLTSENRFRALVENNYDIITLIDESFKIIYTSPSVTRVMGFDTGEIKQLENIKNVHPDDRAYAANLIKEAIANPGKPLNAVFRRQHKAGHYVWLEGKVTNLLHDKHVEALVTNFRDITQRVEAEEKLVASEKFFRALIENSNDIITLMDSSFKLKYRSNVAARVTGWTNEEMVGMDATKNIHPEDHDYAAALVAEVMNSPAKTISTKFRMRHKNGHYLWVEGTFTNLLHDNDVQAVVFNFRDISDRVKAEQQKEFDAHNLNALINNTHDMMWSVDKNYQLITGNEAFDKLLVSMTGKIPVKGKNLLLEEFDKPQLKRFKQYYRRALAGEIFTETEHDEGIENVWSEISFYPIYEGRSVIGTACFSRDITEKKKAEEEIQKSNERFELVVKATNDVIWDWDMVTNSFWRNRNYYSHFGYTEQVGDADPGEWQKAIHPEDKARVLSGIGSIIQDKQHFWTDEYRFLKADKTVAFVMDCGYVLYDKSSNPYRMVGAMLDITARKISEQQLMKSFDEKKVLAERMSIILDTLPANIAVLDSQGVIAEVNKGWRDFANENKFNAGNYGIGLNYIEISENSIGKDKKEGRRVAAGIKSVIQQKKRNFVLEYPCHSPSKNRWFRMIVTPLRESGQAGAVVMHIDISEVHRLQEERLKAKTEEQIKITQAMLQSQEKERTAIGRELHDNVNQILVGTKLLLSMAKGDPVKHGKLVISCIDNIQSAINENRKIAHELVAPVLEKENFCHQLSSLADDMLGISGIEVTVDVMDFQEKILDEQRLLSAYRIAQEQITNIVKYARAKKVNISLAISNGLFKMNITDDGIGMESSKISQGIGLRNIKGRLSIFNGTATVHTAPGKGFKLDVCIPF